MNKSRGLRCRWLVGTVLLLAWSPSSAQKLAAQLRLPEQDANPDRAAVRGEPRTFATVAKKIDRPAGFPRPSAVCFSSRFKHPAGSQDPHDTFQAAADFHATGFYWIIGPNKEWFVEIKNRGYPFQGWLSTILPDTLFGATRQRGRIMDEKGELVTGPWMRAWKGWWGCLNSPEYRAVYLDYVKMYLDAGADSLQMDDPGENDAAVQWGGCYCPYCREKAARLGKSPKDIQRESTEEFYKYIRAAINASAKRHVPFSCNNHPGHKHFFDFAFDFGLEELPERRSRADLLYESIRDAEQRGKAQMFTFVSADRSLTRATIALAYACGSHIIVPWDVYMGTGVPRYFGKAEDFADLYGFARATAMYLDGYEDAAFSMRQRVDARYERLPLAVSGGAPELNLFVRAVPGQADAPVVIHCVDTSAHTQPFHLRVDPASLFGNRPFTVDLLVPARYDRATHARAEQTKDFTALAVKKRLAGGCVTEWDVPAVAPWGLIVIAPDRAARAEVWPPAIMADDVSLYAAKLTVRLASMTRDAVIHYTTDGSEPTASSPVYRQPLEFTDNTTVQARAFLKDAASRTATASFRKGPAARNPSAPDTVAGLRLWLRADDLLTTLRPGDTVARWPAKIGPPMIAEKAKLYDGRMATAPVLTADFSNRLPAVRFHSGTDLLVIKDFANQHLGGAFTVFLVTRSKDSLFGACGNALNGNGGIPRLYLLHDTLTYNASRVPVGATRNAPVLLSFNHDGDCTVATYLNGQRAGRASGPEYAAVGRFGGGHFAIPFWCGNQYHAGDVAEVVAFDRALPDSQRESIEQCLAEKYQLRTTRVWE